MTPIRFYIAPLCLAISAGCSNSAPQYQGNPFDEPVAAPQAAAVQKVQRTPVRPLPRAPLPEAAQIAERPPLEPSGAAVSFAAPVSQAPVVGQSSAVIAGSPSNVQAPVVEDEILVEAHRVRDAGDVSGEIDLLSVAGSRGNAQAFYELARIHLNGEGVAKSPEAAIAYLNQAMGMGHDESTRVLGWLYVMGTGVAPDIEYGKRLLAKAAETSVRAQREFGMALANQRVPHLDEIERGLEMLQKAALAGDAEAASAYSAVFAKTESPQAIEPARRPATPAEPLKERALRGDVGAMYDYALAVSLGKVHEQDAQFMAYCWYSVAASRGHAQAAVEARTLGGVRVMADRAEPGKTERCIADLNAKVDSNAAGGR